MLEVSEGMIIIPKGIMYWPVLVSGKQTVANVATQAKD